MVTTKTYTFSNVTDDHTISATFTKVSYTVNFGIYSDVGGSMTVTVGGQTYTATANNPVTLTIQHGTSVTVQATPAATGYTFLRFRNIQGQVSTDNPYTFTLTEDWGWCYAEFKAEDALTITASAGTGGTITPSGEVEVAYNDSQTFTVTADSNYEISEILVDGVPISLE